MHRYIPVLAKNKGFLNIGEKIVQHQARKYGETKFGMSRFINGFLDLITISFLSKFGKRPMHFFGLWGTLMFIFGFFSAGYLGVSKLYKISQGMKAILITDNPWFYICNGKHDIRDATFFSWLYWRTHFKNQRGRKLLHNQRKIKLLTP